MLPLLVSLAALAAAGCAKALHPPPPLETLSADREKHLPAEVPELLTRAERLFAERAADRTEPARQAAEIWLTAAAADRTRTEGLVGAARAKVWLTEHETETETRERDATMAVHAAQWCVRIAPRSAACAYWLGAALGVQARERPSTGLSALPRIVEAFERAAASDPLLEDAGPDRALALLYLRAPGWPTGPGDPGRGLDHARRAVELKPDFPPNELALAEALRAVGDTAGERRALEKALETARGGASSKDPDSPEWAREAERSLGGVPGH